ncbi:single-stranded DNA-binding protein [Phycicoccus sonneratiae]|uniref:Single-stranded DNA-binding protein n=1 Tax=Phycicoccus sonneratiae TaxID=2807628 RepID=A0ABS2CIF6_9MICO|nr:single-stranded DNA-binding protein [Phycicoccus sonneraticus]MBM6399667.1 single-stranded DNA-binding protein [Phycicoccus sonneraticus]
MPEHEDNRVRLVGRVTSIDEPRTLPSGDVVHGLRVTVPRPRARGRDRPGVDTLDVACWSPGTRRVAARLVVGARVEVDGALRRRFFRAGGSAASRYEVEAVRIRRAPDEAAGPGEVRNREAPTSSARLA